MAKLSGLRGSPRGDQRPDYRDSRFLLHSTFGEERLEAFKQEVIQSLRVDT